TTDDPFAYRKFMKLLPEIMKGERLNFLDLWLKMVASVEQKRNEQNIRPWDYDGIAVLISEELLNIPEYKSKKSVKSFYKAANSTYKAWDKACILNSERYDIFFSEKVWLKESRILYDLIKDITREKIVLVDADDLVQEPEKIL
ncbi:15537_t:CDS:2, partial [Cetraspora pellucida]